MIPFNLTRREGGGAILELAGDVTVEHVRDLHAALCVAAPVPRHLEVQCGGVTRLDAPAVQLLFAAARAAEQATAVGRNDAWTRAFARYGLNDPFAQPR